MASIGDNSAALEVMRDANNDFLAFIRNLKTFLSGRGPVTFDIGPGFTVSSIQDMISDYRKGIFDEVLIGGQDSGTQVRLHVDSEGNLVVSDVAGNLGTLLCANVSTAKIDRCTATEVVAQNCRIDSILGDVSVTGGTVNLSRLVLDSLNTATMDATSMTVGQLDVQGSLSCPSLLTYGARKFVPRTTRNVFYRNNSALNGAASLMEFAPNGDWIISDVYNGQAYPSSLKPSDLGIVGGDITRRPPIGSAVPDLIRIHGANKYANFSRHSGLFALSVSPIAVPPNVLAYVAAPNDGNYTALPISGTLDFAAVMMWPTGMYPSVQAGSGKLYIMSFAPADIGKEVYYEIHENPWVIYRLMRIEYDAADRTKPVGVTFDGRVTLPSFSCARYIVKVHDSLTDSSMTIGSASRVVVYSLE